MDLLTRSLAVAGTGHSWSLNQTANATARGSGSATLGSHATLANGSASPAIITAAPSANFLNSSAFSGNGSVPLITSNATSFANDTLCWLSYWSHTDAAWTWKKSHTSVKPTTIIQVSTVRYTTPAIATSGNRSYTVLCDGLPRFDTEEEAEAALQPIPLPTPIVTTTYITTNVTVYPTYTATQPQCTIKDSAECSNLWRLYATSRSRSLSSWSSTNVLTVSLASPPRSVVVNGETTRLAAAGGDLPILTLHETRFTPSQNSYSISGATSLTGQAVITPGGQGIFTWNGNDIYQLAYGPRDANCNGPPKGTIISSQCATAQCTIAAPHVELLYFPPPSTSRDLCANTSPGYNSYSVSIFSQPHVSTVINSTTFWQDKAYVRYSALSAYKTCSIDNLIQITTMPVGGVYSGQYIEVASSDISSICSWRWNPALHVEPIGATAFPFNFDDLNGPIPASAYQCIPQCIGKCSSIVSDNWLTGLGLAVPTQIRSLDPAWASCVPYFLGAPDPPIALGTRKGFLSTTSDAPPKPTSPAPGITPDPVVTATNDPRPTNDPKPTNDPSNGVPDPVNPSPRPQPNPGQTQPVDTPGNNQSPTFPNAPVTTPFTQTIPIPQHTNPAGNDPPTAPITTIGGKPVNIDPANPGVVIVGDPGAPGSQTISVGGAPLVVSGTTVSILPTGGALVVSGQSNLIPVGTVGGQTVWMDPSRPNVVLVGDPGSPQQMQTLSMNGNVAVISRTTVSLALPTGSGKTSNSDPTMIMGMSFVLDPASGDLIVDGKYTMRPGSSQISVNGHTVFFDPSGSSVYIDGVEYRLAPSLVMKHDGTASTVALPTNSAALASYLSSLSVANSATASASTTDSSLNFAASTTSGQTSSGSSKASTQGDPFESTTVGSAPGAGTGNATGTAKPNAAAAQSRLVAWHWFGGVALLWMIRWSLC